jgi:TRAP-type C4-dicarboxylate transport system permease small subunit
MTEPEEIKKEEAPEPSSFLLKLSDMVNGVCEKLLFVLMLAMIFFTTIQVIFRVFFTAFSWTEEITCFLLFYASLVGAAVAFKRGSHIAVTFIAEHLPGGGRKFLAVVVHLLGILFFAVVAVYGSMLVQTEAAQLSPGMQISMSLIYAAFPAVGAVIMLHLAAGIRRTLRRG